MPWKQPDNWAANDTPNVRYFNFMGYYRASEQFWEQWRYFRIHTLHDWMCWVAWKLPHDIVMWCFYRVLAHATSGKWSNTNPAQITAFEAIERWDEGN